jgi:hypothetical protein
VILANQHNLNTHKTFGCHFYYVPWDLTLWADSFTDVKLCLPSAIAVQILTNPCLQHPYQSICTLLTLPNSSLLHVNSSKSWWTWAMLVYFYLPGRMTFNLQPWYSCSLTPCDKWLSTRGNFELLKSIDYTNPQSKYNHSTPLYDHGSYNTDILPFAHNEAHLFYYSNSKSSSIYVMHSL